ncbi:DMT family transporter [Candidatus Microgenomates bacterium]|nr:MAG: DMT family transporter [Candidatus Microgenomates bacterium]
MKISNTHVGIVSLILCSFLWGFFGIFARTVGFQLPLFYQSWTRNILTTLLLLPFCFYFRSFKKVKVKDWFWIILRTTAGVFSFASIFIAFNFIPIGTGYFIFHGGALLTGFALGAILFKEKLTPIRFTSLLLALAGLTLIYSLNFDTNIVYLLLAFAGGLGSSFWNTLSKKISDNYSALYLNFLDFLAFGMICLIVSLVLGEKWTVPTFTAPWIVNVIFAVLFAVTGQLVIVGFKYTDAQIGSLIILMEILFGIILGFLFYQETLSLLTILGGMLIIIAVVLPEIKWKKVFYRFKI